MSESSTKSVSVWIAELKSGDDEAAQRLWERYCVRLGEQARRYLRGLPRRVIDEEDVRLAAFNSLCTGARDGRFPQLNDRHDLWQVLMMITERKAIDAIRHEHRQKRGGGEVRGESVFITNDGISGSSTPGIEQVIGGEATPEYAALAAEECQRLLEKLGDDNLRQVALWKLEGYSNQDIAERLGCVVRSVERKLNGIRAIWSKEAASHRGAAPE